MKLIGKSELSVYPVGQGTLFGRNHKIKLNKDLIKVKKETLEYGFDLGMNLLTPGKITRVVYQKKF